MGKFLNVVGVSLVVLLGAACAPKKLVGSVRYTGTNTSDQRERSPAAEPEVASVAESAQAQQEPAAPFSVVSNPTPRSVLQKIQTRPSSVPVATPTPAPTPSEFAVVRATRPRARPMSLGAPKTGRPQARATPRPVSKERIRPQARPTFTSLKGFWDNEAQQGRRWSYFVASALDTHGSSLLDMTPADAESYCPAFKSLDREGRKAFWVALISRLSYFESSFDPETAYTEKMTDRKGQSVVSRGLLQISIESANGAGCEINREQDLHDPQTNLECGVILLTRFIVKDGRIRGEDPWKGAARYWSPFRHKNVKIRDSMRSLELCQSF